MYVNNEVWMCIFGTLVSILLRCCTTLHSYSGQGKSPMFGDYEAQRHWMEITFNLPVKEWYHNSTNNDLQYWGLDYPPLTAYHSYVCGVVADFLNPDFIMLYKSRGYESEEHKLFMRYTVIIADLLLYIPAVFLYFIATKNIYENDDRDAVVIGKKKKGRGNKANKKDDEKMSVNLGIILSLLYPGLILIDHGHFQYNCVSLAFAVLAITFVCVKHNLLGSIFFCFALNYKQMELYHALPFFLYLLSTCIPKPGQHAIAGFLRLFKLAFVVVLTFVVIWFPFLFDLDDLMQVVHRLFPLARGLFEDKVANVWCALNVFYKFKTKFDNLEMVRYCAIVTLTMVLPSSVDLFLRPNVKKFVLAIVNSSLAFFLFSYQVHEKSILLAAVPVTLLLPNDPVPCFWFLVVSTFSMLPLFVKDGLVMAFVALTVIYIVVFRMCFYKLKSTKENTLYAYYKDLLDTLVGIHKGKQTYTDIYNVTIKHFLRNFEVLKKFLLYLSLLVSLLGCVVITFLSLVFEPPEKYPDFFPLIISAYSCVHFLGFFVYFNVEQLKVPQSFDDIKVKSS